MPSIKHRLLRKILTVAFVLVAAVGSASAQVTSLTMSSDQGDYIGQGANYSFTDAEARFTVSSNFQGGVNVSVSTPDNRGWWYLEFARAGGGPLTVGAYTGATRYPFNTNENGLSVSGDGRGCNNLTGSFEVRQISYGADGSVTAFDATFEQHCEGATPAMRGQVRYNAFSQLYLSLPSNLTVQVGQSLTATVRATEANQRRVTLTATSLPDGASFVDLGNNTGTFSWTPNNTQIGQFVAAFRGDNGVGNVATASLITTVQPPPPYNDEISSAAPVRSVPYSNSQVVTTATTASDDPYCMGNAQSVWYAVTVPANMRVEVNTFGSGYDTTIGVYTGRRGALTQIGCSGDVNSGFQSRVRFDAVAGVTYYVMIASQYYRSTTANLSVNFLKAPPAFAFGASVNSFGTVVSSTGAVTLTGTVNCTAPSFVQVEGTLRQTKAGIPINGYWSTFVPCTGTNAFSTPVVSTTSIFKGRSAALFSGGKADVSMSAQALDPETGEYKWLNSAQPINLRGK